MSDGLSHDECLDINEPYIYDELIQSLQYFEFTSQTFANRNTVGHTITINTNAQDVYALPSQSYINMKVKLRRNDNNNPYAAAHEVALLNNAMMYLFTEVKYELDSKNIEKLSSPGQITSMLVYLSQPDDFSTSAGLKYCWNKDTNTFAFVTGAGYTSARNPEYNAGFAARKGLLCRSNPRGHFSFNIPLSHILGFAEFKKVIYGQKHTLTLTRGADTQAIYRANGVPDGEIDIIRNTWHIPQIQLSPEYLAGMRSLIEQKVTIPISFRARSCEQSTLTQTRNYTWRLSVTGGVEKP